MNKGIQIILSIFLMIIIGGLVLLALNTNQKSEIQNTNQILNSKSEITNNNNGQQENMNEETKIVILKTNKGDIKLELFARQTPKTVANFIKLTNENFYDGVRFHRVIKNFMIQSGDPLSKDVANKSMWGTGGPGYQFEDEFVQGLSNVKGTISMANSGPGTNGSQFFINTVDNLYLDGRHTVFGKVIEGMDVVDKINNTPTNSDDKPLEDVLIADVMVE